MKKMTEAEIRAERSDCVEHMEEKAKEYGIAKPKKTTLDHYYNKPIKENYVLLMGLGKNVRGNMQYILDELNHNPKYAHLQMFVRTAEETDEIVKNFIEKNGWERTSTVYKTAQYDELLETCKYMITEIFFSEFWIKREEQVVINIWHGTPLKRLGLEKKGLNKFADGPTQRNFIVANYLLYPNEYTRDNMLLSYRVADLCTGKIVMGGYPRTGAILDQSHNEETLKKLAPNGEHIYVYMPTWKDYLSLEKVLEESKQLLDYLDANLRDDQILYVNLHHKVSDSLDYSIYRHIKQFPSDIDSYRIQAASDALITDYSSVFYDYSASGKNIVLYCNDLELYEKKRGTYMDLRELPFHKARTPEEVLEKINEGKTYDDSQFVQEFCGRDSIDNAKKLCHLFVDDESELEISQIPQNHKKSVLLYTDGLELSGQSRKFLKKVSQTLAKDVNLYVSGDAIAVRENKTLFAPMLKKLEKRNVIGVKTTPRYTKEGYYAKALYEQGHLTFSEAMKVMQYDYYAEYMRYFGTEEFESIEIFETLDAERLLALCGSSVPTEVVVSKSMLESVEQGNQMLKDALEYLMNETDVKVTIPRLLHRRAKKIL